MNIPHPFTCKAAVMGQSESSFKRTYQETVAQLSTVQLGEISARSEPHVNLCLPQGRGLWCLIQRSCIDSWFMQANIYSICGLAQL